MTAALVSELVTVQVLMVWVTLAELTDGSAGSGVGAGELGGSFAVRLIGAVTVVVGTVTAAVIGRVVVESASGSGSDP